MSLKSIKKLLVSLVAAGFILSSALVAGSSAMASARYSRGQDQDRWWDNRRPNREEAKEFRRQEKEEMKEVRQMDRDHRLRYQRENQVRVMGYFDSAGSFHRYGYYDRWGYFHKD
jgi:hypothetical protein